MATCKWKKLFGSSLVVACLALAGAPEAASDFMSVDEKELVEELVTQLEKERAELHSTAGAVKHAAGAVGSAAGAVRDQLPLLVGVMALQFLVGFAILRRLNSIGRQVELLTGSSVLGGPANGSGDG